MRSLVIAAVLAATVARADSARITAVVVDRPAMPHCGVLEVWTLLHVDASADPSAPRGQTVDARRLPVAVQCLELVHPDIAKGDTITLALDGPKAAGPWGKTRAWIAIKPSRVARP
jgi:hypothetical protein